MSYDLVLDARARLDRLERTRFAVAAAMVTVLTLDVVAAFVAVGRPWLVWVALPVQLGLGVALGALTARINAARQAYFAAAAARSAVLHGGQ